jgi:Flp pilus assembly protein TadD
VKSPASALDAIPATSDTRKTAQAFRKAMQAGRFSEAASLYALKSEGSSDRSERFDAIRYCTAAWLAGDRAGARSRAVVALASLPRVEHRQRFDWELIGERALFEAFAGEVAAARDLARESMELMPVSRSAVEGPRALSRAAIVHLLIGDSERALKLLDEALSVPSSLVLHSHPDFEPLWGPLRQDPRYRAAVAKWSPRN